MRFTHCLLPLLSVAIAGGLVGGVTAPAAAVHSRAALRRVDAPSAATFVTLARVPDGGIQPQAAVDAHGVLHLVYFKGDPAHGDLFYVRKNLASPAAAADAPFSAPVRVNSRPSSAVALGTIRGAQVALGDGGRVYVAWNGSDQADKTKDGATPMLFTRSNRDGTAFEAERDLISGDEVIDGGGSLASDPTSGAVYVLWHGTPKGRDEAAGGVYLARSSDGGATFRPATRIAAAESVGACGCCGMRAVLVGGSGSSTLYVLYRAAAQNVHRDTMLLTSRDDGATFTRADLQPWRADVCPMSLFGLAPLPGGSGVVGTWETQGKVYLSSLDAGNAGAAASPARRPFVAVPRSRGGEQKYPLVAVAPDGKRLVAWAEGAGWQRGGTLAWQVYAPDGAPTLAAPDFATDAKRIPTWSLPAPVARPDGTFLILY